MKKSRGAPPRPAVLIRPGIRRLRAYVPGEQPKVRGLVKLNTNENPYPPAPEVYRAIRRALDGRLRLYPNPRAQNLRNRLARRHRSRPENVLVGNGSDELLALATRAFVEPESTGADISRCRIQYFHPSYSLYPVLADIHGARRNPVPLESDFSLPTPESLRRGGRWDFGAALTLITTPNAPSGRGYGREELEALCRRQRGVVILDEAYVDFAREHAMALALNYPHVLVSRTFSKAYSLCFLRVGYCVGHPDLIEALDKVRDSYNVNGLGQVAAEAALTDLAYYRANFRRIIATRRGLREALIAFGFRVLPSETNFLLVEPPGQPAQHWMEALRQRGILVRWFAAPEVRDYLRISIGTEEETGRLLEAVRAILQN